MDDLGELFDDANLSCNDISSQLWYARRESDRKLKESMLLIALHSAQTLVRYIEDALVKVREDK